MKERDFNEKRKILLLVACFVLTFLFRYAYILGSTQMRVASDDMGISCGVATLSGCDWSVVMKYVRYYGQAFSVLLTPFFSAFCENPSLIWYGFQMFYLATAAIGSCILLYIGEKYFDAPISPQTVVFAAISSLAFDPANDMSNEPGLFLSSVLLVWLLLAIKNENSKVKIIVYQILSLLVVMFGYLTNSRGMALWLAVPCVYVWFLLKHKKQIGYWYVWLSGIPVSYILSQRIQEALILRLWNVDLANGETMINMSTGVVFSDIIEMLSARSGIKAFLMSVISEIYAGAIHTYGIFIVIILVLVFMIFAKKSSDYQSNMEVAIMATMVCCFLGMAGMSTSSYYGGVAFWRDLNEGIVSISYNALFYYRYFGSFIAPAIFATLVYLAKENRIRKRLLIIGGLFFGLVVLFTFKYTISVAKLSGECIQNATVPYLNKYTDKINVRILLSLLLVAIFFVAIYIVVLKKRWMIPVLSLMLILIPFIFTPQKEPYKALLNDHCDTGYYLVNYLIETGEDIDDICVVGETKTKLNYQYALMKHHVVEEDQVDCFKLVFANNDSELLNDDFEWIQLDNNESVYVKDDDLKTKILTFLEEDRGV